MSVISIILVASEEVNESAVDKRMREEVGRWFSGRGN